MAIPWNIRGSASQILSQDKTSSQYRALLAIADVPHPDRSILGGFINDAFDPQEAARYFLHRICAEEGSEIPPEKLKSKFLSEWKTLVDKFRPTLATSISSETKMLIYQGDGGRCCLTHTPFKSYLDPGIEYVHMIPPCVFTDPDLAEGYTIDANLFRPQCDPWLYMMADEVILDNSTPELAPMISEGLLHIHARFSKSLAWMDAKQYMDASINNGTERKSFSPLLVSPFSLLRHFWLALPSYIRASIYDALVWVGSRIYGPSLSMTVFRLPFGLYLRRGSPMLASKYHVEAHTLHMIEQLTHIPAPRAIDVFQSSRTMTDEQVKQAVNDLKNNLSELRKIPPHTTEFRICNSQGGGILDWRLSDSQREELRFRSEADFNKYLTDPFGEEIRKRAAKSHAIHHEIYFTHGDLNPRNILAENGRITGIVDWENAGWFPEYWEYTKAHFSVRSLMRWLADVVDQVFEGYRDELQVENMLSDLLSPF
ncbi:hypothetical protein BP00DRAFT_439157 [Aspergillus indologenus CBS 114.80]|uniref:Aminoglycoside phosphotransferase domain-containing protein n=1 Tax=Aspergillus indologenus CBS 114.80 TaxID=1450541 RepID=A0A2V5HUI1_9EURO|nr:hypothetical protein BP00DRAFT_439157 [Aspergillus indologenus CBS 114.80]